MKRLAILLPNGAATSLSSLILTVELIEKANEYFTSKGKLPVFKTLLVGSGKTKITNGPFILQQDKSTDDADNVDMIIVPSLGNDVATVLKKNKKNIEWVANQYKKGAEVATLCTGAFILGWSGLLRGKECSTHWAAADTFRSMFPDTKLAIDKIITDEHGIYTTGGALSSLNLILYLIEKYYNRETVVYCAKFFEINLDRTAQSAFIIFSGQKNHNDEEIKKAQLFIENNVGERIIVEELSSKFAIDRRNFDRRFRKATGNSPVEYMQRVKMEAAKKYFETSRKTVNEIMYEVGYSDMKAFREVFKKVTGLSPVEYRKMYNKEAMN